jgi:hypothetical protein
MTVYITPTTVTRKCFISNWASYLYSLHKQWSQRRNLNNYKGRKRIIPTFGFKLKTANNAKCRKSKKENRNGRNK